MTTGATATVKGGLFGDSAGLSSLTQISGKGSNRMRAAQALSSLSTYAVRHTLRMLDGAVAGSLSQKTYGLIDASSELGGKRTVTNTNLINRNTTAGDVVETKADILSLTTRTTFGASPPVNKDGSPLGEKR